MSKTKIRARKHICQLVLQAAKTRKLLYILLLLLSHLTYILTTSSRLKLGFGQYSDFDGEIYWIKNFVEG